MPRKKKVEAEEVKVTAEVVKVKPASKAKTATKKTSIAKTPAVAKCSSLDDITVDQLQVFLKSEEKARKVIQLINDYAFEKDQVERIRCISIAFGNWRHGAEFDESVSSKENFEQHNFTKCKTILERLVTV